MDLKGKNARRYIYIQEEITVNKDTLLERNLYLQLFRKEEPNHTSLTNSK